VRTGGRNRSTTLIDEHGHLASSTAGKDLTDWRHDEVKWTLDRMMGRAGIQHRCEVMDLFQHCVRHDGEGEEPGRRLQGLIPDFMCKLEADQKFVLMDVKCITVCKTNHKHTRLTAPCGVVQWYQNHVQQSYITKARRFDRRPPHGGARREWIGPLEAELRRNWLPVKGLVFGPYGAASGHVKELLVCCARAIARAEWRDNIGARTEDEAFGRVMADMRRTIGCLAVRTHAELKLNRMRQLESAHNRATRTAAAARRRASRMWHARRAENYWVAHTNAREDVAPALLALWRSRARPGRVSSGGNSHLNND
jgi:hypothetical protein